MKLTITTYLFSIGFLLSIQSSAQEPESSQPTKSVVKIDNPYKKGRTKWLNSHGFNTKTYDWRDAEINLYVEKAVKNRTTGNILAYSGGGIIVTGLLLNLAGSLAKEINSSNPDEPYQVFKAPYYLGGALSVSGIVMHLKAESNLKKAKAARQRKFK